MDGSVQTSDLPQKVFEQILKYVCTPHFLALRLVSRLWNKIIASLLRQRLQKLKTMNYESLNEIAATFKHSTHSPISSLDFSRFKLQKYGHADIEIPLLRDITCNSGHHIQSLTLLGYNLRLLLEFLQFTPCLKHLSHCPSSYDNEEDGDFVDTYSHVIHKNLRALTNLRFDIFSKVYLIALKMLMKGPLHLEAIDVDISQEQVQTFWSEIPLIISHVPKISLRILSDVVVDDLSPFHLLNIHELRISIPPPTRNEINFYNNLERFLETISPTLESLTIFHAVSFGRQPIGAQLRLAKTKNLKIFTMEENIVSDPYRQSLSFNHIQAISVDTFPAFEKFCLVTNGGVFYLLLSRVFESVRELNVKFLQFDGNFAENAWHKIFPNLRKLVTRANLQSFRYIVKQFTALEELKISINLKRKCWSSRLTVLSPEPNIDQILSGCKFPQAVYFGKHTIPESRNSSILSLSALKKLKLDCSDAGALSDAGVALSLLQLQPLQQLVVINGELSKTSISKLEEYHSQFQYRSQYKKI